MRLHFTLSPNAKPVCFDYQHRLTGVFYKWLADNKLHDSISLYSLAWLDGGFARNGFLHFPNGARWFVSFYEDEFAEKLANGALAQPEMFCGMRVSEIRQQTTPDFGAKYKFKAASPIFAKGKSENGKPPRHYLCHEPEADLILTATLVHKMDEANKNTNQIIFGEEDKGARVSFDRQYSNPKIKKVNIAKIAAGKEIFIQQKASVCPVIVEGTPKAVRFAWNVGIGNGTGSCFGSLR